MCFGCVSKNRYEEVLITRVNLTLAGTAERNLEWGGPFSRAERAIHLEGSERIGPEKF